jgi:nucleoside triphosphate diphosphatase
MKNMPESANCQLQEVNRYQGVDKLLAIMRALRDPDFGCPWDQKQDFASLLPYTVEEVYEVVEAIEQEDLLSLKDELGDLFFQIVFYAQIGFEQKAFEFNEVVENICDKLIRRHPHVFSDAAYTSEDQLNREWENQKQRERVAQNALNPGVTNSLLDDIPKALPELKRAQKIQSRVAKGGFDWPDISHVWAKMNEEQNEVMHAAEGDEPAHLEEELGDLMFTLVNLTRHYGFDADMALRKANQKFERRFRQLETIAEQPLASYNIEQLEALWQKAKSIPVEPTLNTSPGQ